MGAIRPLLERERELATLDALLTAVAVPRSHGSHPAGRAVLIAARPGLGRSALLRRLEESASDRGLLVRRVRASRAETGFAFAVARRLLEPLLHDSPADLEAADGLARSVLEGGTGSPDDDSPAVLQGLYRLIGRLARRTPLALLIDDLQWCDAPSSRLLGYLARRLDRLPVLLALTLRSRPGQTEPEQPEPDAVARQWLGELGAELVPLELRALSRSAVARFARGPEARTLPETLIDTLHRTSGGDPSLLAQVAGASWLQGDGVDVERRAASTITRLRLARLESSAVATAEALAVLGGSDDPGAVAVVSQSTEQTTDAELDGLIDTGIVVHEARFEFVHPLMAESIAEGISPARRQAMHRRAADYLLGVGRPAEEVAVHLLALPARGHPETISVLCRAAETARRRGATNRVVDYLRRAVAESSTDARRAEVLATLGAAEAMANDISGALNHLGLAFDTSTDPRQRAEIAGPLARIALFAGSADETLQVLRRATVGLPSGPLRTGLSALRAYAASIAGIHDDEALPPPPTTCRDLGDCLLATASAWRSAMHGGSAQPAAELAARALADRSLITSDWAYMALVAATVLVLADDERGGDAWAEAERALHDPESPLTSEGVLVWQSWALLERGHPREALSVARSYFVQLGKQCDAIQSSGADYGHGLLLRALVELGALDEARQVGRNAQARRVGSDGDLHRRRGMIELLLAEHRYHEAEAAVDELHRLRPAIQNPVWLPAPALRVRTLIGLGRSAAAVDAARSGLAQAQRWGTASVVGSAQRSLGEALDSAGDDDCLTALANASTLLEQASRPLEWARTAVSWGSALRRRGHVIDARPLLTRAAGIADDRGCHGLAERALSELRAAGGRRASALRTGLAALTEREWAVSRLAASGLSNRQIALELHVGAKTVETHLSSVYRKLQVLGRAELAARLAVPG
ncbi:AAA family ATPase [Micropruina sp.]|uniref:helix-turn-helix transcriptional regulator n=1 Tax=Micropruina sp. TaxID=2737536 RepID=UPI0026251C1E|nr:AAA family ATPase [Micropruina sp.]